MGKAFRRLQYTVVIRKKVLDPNPRRSQFAPTHQWVITHEKRIPLKADVDSFLTAQLGEGWQAWGRDNGWYVQPLGYLMAKIERR